MSKQKQADEDLYRRYLRAVDEALNPETSPILSTDYPFLHPGDVAATCYVKRKELVQENLRAHLDLQGVPAGKGFFLIARSKLPENVPRAYLLPSRRHVFFWGMSATVVWTKVQTLQEGIARVKDRWGPDLLFTDTAIIALLPDISDLDERIFRSVRREMGSRTLSDLGKEFFLNATAGKEGPARWYFVRGIEANVIAGTAAHLRETQGEERALRFLIQAKQRALHKAGFCAE